MPSKRAPQALRDGEGDVLCYTRAAWIGSDFQFSQPVFDNAEVVAARATAPTLTALGDLRRQRVGTVLGYRHPEVDAALGSDFRRHDAVDMAANLRMLRAGRHAYALTDRLTLRDLQRRHPDEGLREDLAFHPFQAVCAVSRRSSLPLKALDDAIAALQRQGTIAAILRRYAP
jgi:ABC-type amino acid transport substrate-binding protein